MVFDNALIKTVNANLKKKTLRVTFEVVASEENIQKSRRLAYISFMDEPVGVRFISRQLPLIPGDD